MSVSFDTSLFDEDTAASLLSLLSSAQRLQLSALLDRQRVHYEHVSPDVELPLVHEQRALNVPLQHPAPAFLDLLLCHRLPDALSRLLHLDAHAAILETTWLENPQRAIISPRFHFRIYYSTSLPKKLIHVLTAPNHVRLAHQPPKVAPWPVTKHLLKWRVPVRCRSFRY